MILGGGRGCQAEIPEKPVKLGDRGIHKRGGIPKRGGIDYKGGGSYPSAHYAFSQESNMQYQVNPEDLSPKNVQ